jgi:hypothetical protein
VITNPHQLDPGTITELRNAERKLHDVLTLIDKAHDCGVDVSQLRATRDEMMRQIDAYKRNFFNGQP